MGDSEQVLVLTRWGMKWLKYGFNLLVQGGPAETLARNVLVRFDTMQQEPSAFVEEHVITNSHLILQEGKPDELKESRKVNKRLAKGGRSKFSLAVAKVAYNKFGQRPMSEANVLVTRKWLQKYLEEGFPDLRTCDKNLAIDRALFLSFVPTQDFNRYRMVMATSAMERRLEGASPFGRIFRLMRAGDVVE